MNRFIEINPANGGGRRLINTRHIEEIYENEDGTCTIYFAFTRPLSVLQDYIDTVESYEKVKEMIWG